MIQETQNRRKDDEMEFVAEAYTDAGTQKRKNQDSLLIGEAQTVMGPAVIAAICDGMGGLEKGELASAVVIQSFWNWFENRFPALLGKGMEEIQKEWDQLIEEQNRNIMEYSLQHQLKMGTTLTVLLLTASFFLAASIGDSRLYWIEQQVHQITRDHTFVQREVELGRISEAQKSTHPNRNLLLQCIGCLEPIRPDYFTGKVKKNTVLLLCSDGFYHEITKEEILQSLNAKKLTSKQSIRQQLQLLAEKGKKRGEKDNLSAVAIRIS